MTSFLRDLQCSSAGPSISQGYPARASPLNLSWLYSHRASYAKHIGSSHIHAGASQALHITWLIRIISILSGQIYLSSCPQPLFFPLGIVISMPTKTLFAALLVGLLSSVLASARMQHESPHSRFAKRVETQTPITKPKIAGWLVGWGGDLHSGLYKKYEELSFAFALTDRLADPGINTTVDNIPQLLPNATKLVDNAGAHRLVSIGGWTGSQYVSPFMLCHSHVQ